MNSLQLSGILISDSRLSQRSWGYCVYLLFFVPASFVALLYLGGQHGSQTALHFVYYSLVFSHLTYRFSTTGPSSIAAPDVIFVMAFTLVNWGMITSLWLGLVPNVQSDLRFPSSVTKSLHLTIVGLVAFLIAYELAGEAKTAVTQAVQKSVFCPRQGWGLVGITLFMLGVALHIIGLIGLGPDAIFKHGYVAIQVPARYTDSRVVPILLSLSIPISSLGVFTYIAASTMAHGKLFYSRAIMILWLAWVGVVLLEGDRGGALKLTLPALLLQHYIIKPVKFRYLIALGLSAMIVFSALAFVRKSATFSPKRMVTEYLYERETNESAKWYSIAYEVGYSFQILNITVHEVPRSEGFWFGASWRDAAIHIIPFAQGFAMKQKISKWDPATWITVSYYGTQSSGKGYNVVAEGYLNFGTPGVFLQMGALGALLRWLVRQFRQKPSASRLIIMLGGLAPTILIIRNHSNLLLAPLAMLIAFAYLLNWLLGSEPGVATIGRYAQPAGPPEEEY